MVPIKEARSAENLERITGFAAWASRTDHLIRWPALGEHLASFPPGLSEEERVQLLLEFAHTGRLNMRQVSQLVGVVLVADDDGWIGRLPRTLQTAVTKRLETLMGGNVAQRRALERKTEQEVSGSIGIFRRAGLGAVQREHVVARTVGAGLAYALLLLIDRKRPFAKRLRRCPYSKCGRFFLTPEKKLQRRYCNPEHTTLAHDEGAPARMRRNRGSPR